MKRLWIISAILLLLLAGCSASASKGPLDGEGLYKKSCLACHGADLKGGSGPPISNMGSKFSEEEVLKIVNEGVNMMPGKLLTKEEAKLVTKWIIDK